MFSKWCRTERGQKARFRQVRSVMKIWNLHEKNGSFAGRQKNGACFFTSSVDCSAETTDGSVKTYHNTRVQQVGTYTRCFRANYSLVDDLARTRNPRPAREKNGNGVPIETIAGDRPSREFDWTANGGGGAF